MEAVAAPIRFDLMLARRRDAMGVGGKAQQAVGMSWRIGRPESGTDPSRRRHAGFAAPKQQAWSLLPTTKSR